MTGSKRELPYDAVSGCLVAHTERNTQPRACQCSQRPWYARGQAVFALVTYLAALTWATLILLGAVSPWWGFAVAFSLLLALAYAYGSDGKGGAI